MTPARRHGWAGAGRGPALPARGAHSRPRRAELGRRRRGARTRLREPEAAPEAEALPSQPRPASRSAPWQREAAEPAGAAGGLAGPGAGERRSRQPALALALAPALTPRGESPPLPPCPLGLHLPPPPPPAQALRPVPRRGQRGRTATADPDARAAFCARFVLENGVFSTRCLTPDCGFLCVGVLVRAVEEARRGAPQAGTGCAERGMRAPAAPGAGGAATPD